MVDILTRAMNIVDRVRNMGVLSMAATAVFAVLLAFGIMNCILGYRLLRFWMMIFGFFMGAGAGFFFVYNSGTSDNTFYLAAMAGLGIVLAVIAFLIYKAGIFILGAGLGLTLSIYIIHPTTSLTFFLCMLVGVGLGVLALRYAREVIIVGTSLLGGVLAGFSAARLGELAEIPYGIGMSAGFAILGMLIQFAINKPGFEEEEDEEEEVKYRGQTAAVSGGRRRSESERRRLEQEAQEEAEEAYLEELMEKDGFEDYFSGKLDLEKEKSAGEPVNEEEELADLHRRAWEQKRKNKRS